MGGAAAACRADDRGGGYGAPAIDPRRPSPAHRPNRSSLPAYLSGLLTFGVLVNTGPRACRERYVTCADTRAQRGTS